MEGSATDLFTCDSCDSTKSMLTSNRIGAIIAIWDALVNKHHMRHTPQRVAPPLQEQAVSPDECRIWSERMPETLFSSMKTEVCNYQCGLVHINELDDTIYYSGGGMMDAQRIEILDTTLRDGAQGEGVSFSVPDKLKVIAALDQLGVTYIEAGNPFASPRDAELFRYAAERPVCEKAVLAAFGATCRAHTRAEEDVGLRALIDSRARVVSLFGKSSRFQVDSVLNVSPEENLRMIRDSVALLTRAGRQVFFDAEHFFDGWKTDPGYALSVLRTAKEAGAVRLVLCDTNGGTLPEDVERATHAICEALKAPVAIHCHNDSGLATACSLYGVRGGATQVQGTINGLGERCGNANLCEVIPNLMLKLRRECLNAEELEHLTDTARTVNEIANLHMNEKSPYVGRSAFTHKGGMHIDGMLKDSRTFEHIEPEKVGNHRRYLVSEMAGRGALMTRLRAVAPDLNKDSPQAAAIMERLKALEAGGYTFEDADASLALRILDILGRRRRFFDVLDFNVVSRKPEDQLSAQAYVKVRVGEQVEITADEGDGPVNALDCAVRKALARFYPCLEEMRLIDFKVRVISEAGTASRVRVHMENTGGGRTWSTVGVSGNIIEASFIALTDAIEYMLMGGS